MVRTLSVTEPDGAQLYYAQIDGPRTLLAAVDHAVFVGGLREAYLRRYGLLPGALGVGLSGVATRGRVTRGVLTLGILRLGTDCRYEGDPATMRTLVAKLSAAQ